MILSIYCEYFNIYILSIPILNGTIKMPQGHHMY